jgi:hypothetical protein
MRVLAGALLALAATEPGLPSHAGLAVTLAAKPLARSCAVVSTATIVAYDTNSSRDVVYRFRRSDGSASPAGHIAFAGDGAVAQAVRDTWTPAGAKPWIVLEIISPDRISSHRLHVASRCQGNVLATTH